MKPSLFWLKGNKADLILAEINIPQGSFEFLACGEAGKHAVDLVGTDFFGGVCAAGIGPQPEGAEVAQFDDVALGEFIGDDGEQGLDGGDHVGGGEGGHLGGALGKLAQSQASAGLNGGVELLGVFAVGRVAALNDIKFYRHFSLSLYD